MNADANIRCFIALELPGPAQKNLEELIGSLQAAQADVKWVAPENIHLTLKFLGEIPMTGVENVKMIVQRSRGRHLRIATRFGSAGAFPGLKKPEVVWVGLDAGLEELRRIQQDVEGQAADLGFYREPRRFQPHLTLGRVRSQKNIAELSRAIGELRPPAAEFELARLSLIQSTLTPRGPVYQIMETAELD